MMSEPQSAPEPLTPRQLAFVEAYMAELERPSGGRLWGVTTRAAAAAGYAWPDKQGSRLLSYPAIARELKARFAARREQREAKREAERKERDREWKAKVASDDASRVGRHRRRGRYKPRQKCT